MEDFALTSIILGFIAKFVFKKENKEDHPIPIFVVSYKINSHNYK